MANGISNVRKIILALGWRPRIQNGLWDGCTMRCGSGDTFVIPPDFLMAAKELFAEGHWGPYPAKFPQWLASRTRPARSDRGLKESRYYRERIIRDQFMPFVGPTTGKWDGRTRIDTEGNVSVIYAGLRRQMHIMVLEGYYGNVRWDHRAMRDFAAEGRLRYQMLLGAISLALRYSGNGDWLHRGHERKSVVARPLDPLPRE